MNVCHAALGLAVAACTAHEVPEPDAAASPPARIVTIAGVNAAEHGYVDGPAATARFHAPEGLVLDASGENLYIADTNNHAIRRLELATMLVTTVAGGGSSGESDTMPGVPARLHTPRNLVLDPSGAAIYFTDTGNFTVRRLDLATSAVTTVFGTPGIWGSDNGVGAQARFGKDGLFTPWPGAMAIDARDPSGPQLYLADSANQTIRVLDLTTRNVSTLAGVVGVMGAVDGPATSATFNKPTGLALDGAGGLFVAEANNLVIRKVDLAARQVSTVAGKAPANPKHFCENISPELPAECGHADAAIGTDARFRFLYGVSPDGAGGFFAADSHNNLIRHFDMSTTAVTTVAGVQATLLDDIPHASTDSTETAPGTFWHPTHVAVAAPNVLYVADRSANCIRRVELGIE
jgi:sugar lactone lactonase YvrE